MRLGIRHKKKPLPNLHERKRQRKILNYVNYITCTKICQDEREIEMEEVYKFALQIILKNCEKDSYGSKEDIQTICEMALGMGEESEDTER